MTEDPFQRNAILAQLPDREYASLQPHLHLEHPNIKDTAYEPGTPITDIYFPMSAVYSLVGLSNGRVVVEVATTGQEGMVGLPFYLGATTSPLAAFCQVPGDTARIMVGHFRQALSRDGVLHALLNRFTQATMVQVAQNVVCNRIHPTYARMARWLLTTQDRVGAERFQLTQEFLAQMLGVQRPTVSALAQRIQAEGMIRYSRGIMTITNRPQLEQTTCDCYCIVKAEFDAISHPR